MTPHCTVRVTKIFIFEMAHALAGYDGECSNIHGHSYRLHVTLRGKPRKEPGHPKDGMVMDFSLLKKLVKEKVLDTYDHALALNGTAPQAFAGELSAHYGKVVALPFQPTCENLLLDIVGKLHRSLPPSVEVHKVKLLETATSYAEWCMEDG